MPYQGLFFHTTDNILSFITDSLTQHSVDSEEFLPHLSFLQLVAYLVRVQGFLFFN